MKEQKTIVEMTPEDAQLFLNFQKHYQFIKFIDSVGFFGMREGFLTIHFARTGEVGSFDLVERFNHFKVPGV